MQFTILIEELAGMHENKHFRIHRLSLEIRINIASLGITK